MKNFDVLIIGAGASGFACALQALKRHKKVAILDHNASPLKKVKISGGGKCNFTNLNAKPENYVCAIKNFTTFALKTFPPQIIVALLKRHGIKFSEKEKGQLFAQSSQEIIDVLMEETQKAQFFFNCTIEKIEKQDTSFKIHTSDEIFSAKSLVIACGGMSYQNIGASDFGYVQAKNFGHKIIPYRPALVPFNLDNELMKKTIKLKGIALDCLISTGERSFRGNVLFTHFGISGPSVLQSSLYWEKNQPINLNFLPEFDLLNFLKEQRDVAKKKKLSNILRQFFPESFVGFLVEDKDVFISEAANKTLQKIAEMVHNFKTIPIGTQGFKLAEVTCGGVDTTEIDNQTFESKKVKGLFFVGEVLDVTGQLGGYNLQWAWSSGFCAGENV
ncbi:MAG: aminoacetone oxidase family FAD-binding enzyme [Alphaproteobacteria bacterium]|nr:aminoacetone oxidase family FAD-binding enzyme [Alphaproteobacteria bacterium]